ncbi:MAG: hypothetical protein AABY22_31365, partial [Nanoarchaeota archaeon]
MTGNIKVINWAYSPKRLGGGEGESSETSLSSKTFNKIAGYRKDKKRQNIMTKKDYILIVRAIKPRLEPYLE